MKDSSISQTHLIEDKELEAAVRKASLEMWTAACYLPMDYSSTGKPIFEKMFKVGLFYLLKNGWEIKKRD